MATDNPNRIYTGMGDFADVEANLTSIIKRGISDDPRLSGNLAHVNYVNVNPRLVPIKQVPAMFVWCDGSEPTSAPIGGLKGRSLSLKEDFFVTVYLIHSSADEFDNAQFVKYAGHAVKEIVYENFNLNGMMNHDGDLIETSFLPEPFEVGGIFKLMQGFSITVKFSRITRKRRSTN